MYIYIYIYIYIYNIYIYIYTYIYIYIYRYIYVTNASTLLSRQDFIYDKKNDYVSKKFIKKLYIKYKN